MSFSLCWCLYLCDCCAVGIHICISYKEKLKFSSECRNSLEIIWNKLLILLMIAYIITVLLLKIDFIRCMCYCKAAWMWLLVNKDNLSVFLFHLYLCVFRRNEICTKVTEKFIRIFTRIQSIADDLKLQNLNLWIVTIDGSRVDTQSASCSYIWKFPFCC